MRTKTRMTQHDIQMILEELEAWEQGERSTKLTWSILERIFPFTRQTLYSKSPIREAYDRAKTNLKTGRRGKPPVERENDLKLQRLKNRIKELEAQVEEFQELWVRYEYNALRNGIDPDLLRRGLPKKPARH